MDIEPYVATLREDLAVAAAAGGDEARALAERLTAPLTSSARLVLLEALAHAAEELSLELAPGSVEVRLRGRDPEFVVSAPPSPPSPTTAPLAPAVPTDDEGGTARLNLRLPESLKLAIDAAASAEGLSLNAWLIRAAAAGLTPAAPTDALKPLLSASLPTTTTGQHVTGWAR